MKTPATRRPLVLMVLSRAIPPSPESGRESNMKAIHDALQQGGDVRVLLLPSALEQRSTRRWLGLIAQALRSLVLLRPMPLQSLLFWDAAHLRLLRSKVVELAPDAVYFDGVRTGLYLPLLRRSHPQLRFVCDFHDLMSRRMDNLARERQPVSLGYMGKHVPAWIARHVIQPLAASAIPRYEARTLALLERQIMATADAVVLLSSIEAPVLRAFGGTAIVAVIPPNVPMPDGALPVAKAQRFVFIGSDSLLQNRRSIEHLLALWGRAQPALPLHLYGRQKGNYGEVPGIVAHGFVADVAEAYTQGSVLLAPSFVTGGVKTKVLEALAHGVVVVGTATTFEGIEADTEPLVLDDTRLAALVTRPDAHIALLAEAARAVIFQVRQHHSADILGRRWRALVWPDTARP